MNECRKQFDDWWNEFSSAHEDWRFADSDALRWQAWQAAWNLQASPASVPEGWKIPKPMEHEPLRADEPMQVQVGMFDDDGNMLTFPPPPSKETLEAAGHRLALELECLLLDCKDNVVVSRWMDTACEALDAWRNLFPYNGPRLGD